MLMICDSQLAFIQIATLVKVSLLKYRAFLGEKGKESWKPSEISSPLTPKEGLYSQLSKTDTFGTSTMSPS